MQFAIGWNVAPDPRAVVGLEFTQGLAYARRQLPDSSGGWRMPDVTDVSDRVWPLLPVDGEPDGSENGGKS